MRQTFKIGVVLLVALTVALGFSMVSTSKKNDGQLEQLVAEKATMAKELASQQSNFNEIMKLVTEVEDQIASIVKKENLVWNTQSGEYLGSKDKVLKEIAMIDDLVIRSNENIEALAGKLKTSGLKASVLQNKIQRMTADLKERTAVVATLKADLELRDENLKVLTAKVVDLEKHSITQAIEMGQKETEIGRLKADNKELNKVHFAIGSFDELKTKGLVQKEGGFLMFGRKVALGDDLDEEAFSEIDGRQFHKLPIEGKKLQVVSDHPSSSFVIVEDAKNADLKYLEILDNDEFWRISKYLVVSVK